MAKEKINQLQRELKILKDTQLGFYTLKLFFDPRNFSISMRAHLIQIYDSTNLF